MNTALSFSFAANLNRWFFFSSRRRHTRFDCDWSSDVCSSDLAQRDVQSLAHADRHEDLRLRVVSDAEFSLDVGPDRFAKLQQTEIGSVTRFAALQCVNGCLANMPGGDEVRLTDAQRNHVRHRLHDVEKFANARALNVAHW